MYTAAILITFFLGEIYLSPMPERPLTHDRAGVFQDGTFYILGANVWHYSHDGGLLANMAPPVEGMAPTSVFWDGQFYLLCQVNPISKEIEVWTSVIHDGVEIFRTNDFFSRYFNYSDGAVWGWPFKSQEDLWTATPPALATEFQFEFSSKDFQWSYGRKIFAPTNDHKEMNLNYKLVWFANVGDNLAAVSQFGKEIRIYINEEQFESIPMPLVRFSPYKTFPKNPPKGDHSKFVQNWFYSWSRVIDFGNLGNGYYVAYEGVKCSDDGCSKPDVMIQALGASFEPVGEPIVRPPDVFFVGAFDGEVYVLHSREAETVIEVIGLN